MTQEGVQVSAKKAMSEPITALLRQWTQGDKTALDQAVLLIYDQLRLLARKQMRGEKHRLTLNTTVLVNELYLELAENKQWDFENRQQFYAFVASVMRHVVVRYARRRNASKRGGGFYLEGFEDSKNYEPHAVLNQDQVLALGEALEALERLDPRQAKVVELRYFAGLTQHEIAEVMQISRSTIKRDLRTAQMWLSTHLNSQKDDEEQRCSP